MDSVMALWNSVDDRGLQTFHCRYWKCGLSALDLIQHTNGKGNFYEVHFTIKCTLLQLVILSHTRLSCV